MISIVLAGRNDDYGKHFRERLFQATSWNSQRLKEAGVDFEFLLAEWNPLPDRSPLSVEFVRRVPNARAIIIPPSLHRSYSLNPAMPFHELMAKNVALRRARGDAMLVLNADILLGDDVIEWLSTRSLRGDILYRAHRIDIPRQLPWVEMKDPDNQLLSGEGTLPPCYYLGAAGDFCLATRALWFSLGGYNERIRFSTRAKDWQFFLSAASRGIEIEFIGTVYHLDHQEGFRNTAQAQLESRDVHFGNLWDIEFGLPYSNHADWGFHQCAGRSLNGNASILELDGEDDTANEQETQLDCRLKEWLTCSRNSLPWMSAFLLHIVLAARQRKHRLICRIDNPPLQAALSGFQAVGAHFDVKFFFDWDWPSLPGMVCRSVEKPPEILGDGDWILTDDGNLPRVVEQGSGESVDVLPARRKVGKPSFNPLLGRRLLRAYLKMLGCGIRRIAIYGAGSHTEELLQWGIPDDLEVVAIVVTRGTTARIFDLPILRIQDLQPHQVDAILISSCSFEPEMMLRAAQRGIQRVIPLYGDWPKNMWSASTGMSPNGAIAEPFGVPVAGVP